MFRSFALPSLPVFDPQQIQSLLDLGAEAGLVQELVDLLEADVPARLADLERALAEGDAPRALEEAHHLKGSLGNMGLQRFADLARRVEEDARAGRLREAVPLVAAMPEAYREGLAALKAAFPG